MDFITPIIAYLVVLVIACAILAEPLPFSDKEVKEKKNHFQEYQLSKYFREFLKNFIKASLIWKMHIIPLGFAISIFAEFNGIDNSFYYNVIFGFGSLIIFSVLAKSITNQK